MGSAKPETKPSQYILRIKNHLDSHWEEWFDGMTITKMANGETLLSGVVEDQSALHGLLEKVRSLNLTLISVQKVDSEEAKDPTGVV
jgi:hypothetical protein